jgi:hypothetical protein
LKRESVGQTPEMADHSARQERFLKQQVASRRCPYCRRSFQREHVRVAARYEELWVVSVRCGLCRKQQIFHVALADLQGHPELACDPSPEEQEIFESMPAIGSDDVLDMYQFLNEFDGDFRRLFSDHSRQQ